METGLYKDGSVIEYFVIANCQQRKVSLSTLQSKAAKRRDDAQKQPRVPKKKTSVNSVSKANGFTGMSDKARAVERDRLDDQMELEVIQVDTIQPHRKRVSFFTNNSFVFNNYLFSFISCHFGSFFRKFRFDSVHWIMLADPF